MKICVLADAKHIDIANGEGIPCMSVDDLKKLNKQKKLVKKLAGQYGNLNIILDQFARVPQLHAAPHAPYDIRCYSTQHPVPMLI